ncbi:LPS export ABC transporter permease LptF [Endozoicomonas lisbonensis]
MTMVPALGVMVVVAVLSLFVAPKGIQQVEMLLTKQDAMTEFDTLAPGRFQLLEGGNRVTYTEALSSDRQQMQKVFIASRTDDISSPAMSLVLADSGRISTVEEQGQRYLILNDGFRYDMTPGMGNVRIIEYETYGLRMEERTINDEISREQALPTGELMKSDDTRLIAELQWRLSLPLLVPIIVLLAVPLSRVNPRQGRFVKLLPGVLLYLFYLALLMFARSAVDDQRIPATIGVWWVHAIYLAIGLFMVSQEALQLKLGRSNANA